MRHFRKIHLINCGNTYKLEPVEQLLTATTKKLETRLGIHVESVDKHIFRLAEMSDIVTKAILTLEMDMAFFVVHAHESQLSINEDDDEKGYGKIYRALLQATGRERKFVCLVDFRF